MVHRHILAMIASCYCYALLLFFNLPLSTHAYRIGDAVGIIIRTNKHKLEAYRHQMPRFGVSTKTKFETQFLLDAPGEDIKLLTNDIRTRRQQQHQRNNDDNSNNKEELLRMSMSFDEGFHHISWIDIYNPSQQPSHRRALETLIIKFVYSANDGSIHSVQQDTRYHDNNSGGGGSIDNKMMPKSFTVEYVWIEEADIDLESGIFVLCAVVFFVALFGMVEVCCGGSDGDNRYGSVVGGRNGGVKARKSSLSNENDGFAKRL